MDGALSGLIAWFFSAAYAFLGGLAGRWDALNTVVVEHLGTTGQWALWALLAMALLIVVAHAAKLVFNLTRWVVLPSAGLSVLTLTFAPSWSPMQTFPLFLGVTSLILIARRIF